jgi:2-dehydropantoate 2-reductase
MRIVVFGAGAVGGVVAAQLARSGREVAVIARGAHLEAIRREGLTLQWPGGEAVLGLAAVGSPGELAWRSDDVLLLATKSQHSDAALAALAGAPPGCLSSASRTASRTNAERCVARARPWRLRDAPAAHLEPGVVQASFRPPASLTSARPAGLDELPRRSPSASRGGLLVVGGRGRDALEVRQAAVEPRQRRRGRMRTGGARLAARACARAGALVAAGTARELEDAERRRPDPAAPHRRSRRGGGSTWQSLARRTGSIEVDDLNGEIVLLGRLRRPTPSTC